MRRSLVALATVAVFGLGWSAGQVFSHDMGGGEKKDGGAPAGGGPSPEEMDAMMKAATPGEPHKRLASMSGEWTCTGKMWMDPKGPATDSVGGAKGRTVYDGRFLLQEITGDFMGMPFEGTSIVGYDNTLKEYVSVFFCNMGTGIMYGEGTYDAAKKTFNYTSESPDVETGKYIKSRSVERWRQDGARREAAPSSRPCARSARARPASPRLRSARAVPAAP